MTATCYIHAGTHKTGTTYLQKFLTLNEDRLGRRGLYVPKAGRFHPLSGNHGIPAEILNTPTDTANENIRALLAELDGRGAPTTCISSEDFVLLHRHPEALRRVYDQIRSIGYSVRVIIYLRPQVDYAESLYAELLIHGLAMGFDEFWTDIIHHGEFDFNGRRFFPFRYDRALAAISAVVGRENVIVRSYRTGQPTAILADFMPLMLRNWTIEADQYSLPQSDENAKRIVPELLPLFLRHNFADTPSARPYAQRPNSPDAGELPAIFAPLRLSQILTVYPLLAYANWRVLSRHGAAPAPVSRERLRSAFVEQLAGASRPRQIAALFRRLHTHPRVIAASEPLWREGWVDELLRLRSVDGDSAERLSPTAGPATTWG